VNFQIAGRPVDVLIVLDRSESMAASDLWIPMGEAITEVTAQTDSFVNYGLMTFPITTPSREQCVTGGVNIPIGPFNAANIADLVGGGPNDLGTEYGTPTAATLYTSKGYIDSVNDGNPKVILLATDGAPNCNEDGKDVNTCRCTAMQGNDGPCSAAMWCVDDEASAAVAGAIHASGTDVYVMGISEAMEWEDVMNGIASNGGTGEYIPAETPDQFVSALMSIVSEVIVCEFEVDWETLAGNIDQDPTKVNLFCKQTAEESENQDPVNGNVIPGNEGCTADGGGWMWTDDTHTKIKMCDETCDELKSGQCPVISASFGCDTVSPPVV
jgi:hypothetical protein